MESLFAAIEQSLRMLKKSPGFTVVAIAALALGHRCEYGQSPLSTKSFSSRPPIPNGIDF
jgi:hypothetical protein